MVFMVRDEVGSMGVSKIVDIRFATQPVSHILKPLEVKHFVASAEGEVNTFVVVLHQC